MDEDQLTDNTGSSLYYNEPHVFPEPIPHFSSSSSSSSFLAVPYWDVLDSDTEQDHAVNNNVDVIETYNYMDFMKGGSDTWSNPDDSVSNYLNTLNLDFQQEQPPRIIVQEQPLQSTVKLHKRENSKDLAMVFVEWLKSNRGSFSAEDLSKVKLKRSTIESSIQSFGGGRKGMKRLLILILEWVQKSRDHDQGNRMRTPEDPCHLLINSIPRPHRNITDQNGTIFIDHARPDHNRYFPLSDWTIPHLTLPLSPELSLFAGKGISTTMEDDPQILSMVGYTNESTIDFANPYQHTGDYSCSLSHCAMPSPTKEARRTRMDRQKRVILDRKRNQSHHYHQQIDQQNSIENQHAMPIGSNRGNCNKSPASISEDDPANWVYWP